MLLVMLEGPLEEKYATEGAGVNFSTVTVGRIVATGSLLQKVPFVRSLLTNYTVHKTFEIARFACLSTWWS